MDPWFDSALNLERHFPEKSWLGFPDSSPPLYGDPAMMRRYCFQLSLITALGAPLAAQDQRTTRMHANDEKQQIVARLERALPRLMEERKVPGLSIALIQKGELAWHRGFGVKNATTKE